ncbi:DUF4276 family protein [Bathymodiolus septemdierum thioautotrophic gill symbiont]|uniref:DUF4276 family protein n=1 Tax=endosymbiont of Bathymodiolus septemdierum str. Myojin knoll TaxID=1303921 RepID=A0A0P0USJ5_9GAMM|nr:DUF4276 family protein [Bathymodiolus septemdierum thioautotrophic gill symbiont]BAS68118.1 conserved hypothetical protein [endosymbiont of Bathymodiolus septemdierum str. Myojin knoll]
MNLVCFTEERSAKEMLRIVLPKILPNNSLHSIFSFEGKSDLDRQIKKKLKNYNLPGARFLILRDQDSAICTDIKQQLLDKVNESGKKDVSIVRIACHELENFYLGDLLAVKQAFNKILPSSQTSKKFRNADNLANAKQELQRITNKEYQPISGSKAIAPHLKLDDSNTSTSFNALLSGVKKLCTIQP